MNFQFETNEKLMILGVPILKHFRVFAKSHRLVMSSVQNPTVNPVVLKVSKKAVGVPNL